ncbi:MAG: beta-glucosidase, partial [Bacteroidaceae bacterium]|nr:beta-glucosidase [Bacteroidaceae bacterium]
MNRKIITLTLLTALAMPMTVKAQQLREDNIDQIVSALTDDEKVHMLTGAGTGWADPDVKFPGIAGWTYPVPRLGIPSVYLADGPHGVNMNRYRDFDHFDYSCTTTPTSTAMAATFDVNAIGKMGNLIGYELKERGLDVILGPAINLQRTALGGRNQEYMSEDPFLSGKMAAAYIRAVQNHGVGTSVKHFAGNEAETLRKQSDTRATPRTLRELYLKAFEIAVKEGQPWTIMTSYNYINGEHSTERRDLVTDILRGEWGFKGIAITDWDGGYYPVKITSAGTDIIEPGSDQFREDLAKALADGSLDRKIVDAAIKRILEFTVKCPSFKQYKASNDIHREEHLNWVREVGAEGMVLLKNDNQTLPVAPQKVALYGTTSYNFIAGNMGVGGTNGGAYHVTLVEGLRKAGFTIDMNLLRQHTRWQTEEDARLQSEASKDPIMSRILRPARAEELIPQEKIEVKED